MMADQGKYRIGAVSKLTGVSTHTLRMWERRYRTVQPTRSDGGDRLYTDDDVRKLRLLRRLVDRGHSIGRIAELLVPDLEETLAAHEEGSQVEGAARPTAALIDRFVEAIVAMDIAAAERVLGRAAMGLESRELLTELIAPLLEELGRRWERGELRISYEHAASAVLRNMLGTLMRMHVPPTGARTAVATTPPGERHEFGALMAAMLAALHGWNVVYLGPELPVSEIAHAVGRAGASLVLLSVVNADDATRDGMVALASSLPRSVRVVIGGQGAPDLRDALPRGHIVTDLEDLERLLVP